MTGTECGCSWRPPDGTWSGESWTFDLRDVEVAPGAGQATITVTEVRAGIAKDPVVLTVRKVDPTLRIDYFYAIDLRAGHRSGGAVASTMSTSGSPVTLTWATSAATSVSLYGLDMAFDGEPFAGGLLEESLHDGQATVSPTTSRTYTLVASNTTAHAVAQVTVTVTNVAVLPALEIRDGDRVRASLNPNGEMSVISLSADAVEANSLDIGSSKAWIDSAGGLTATVLNIRPVIRGSSDEDPVVTIGDNGIVEARGLRLGDYPENHTIGRGEVGAESVTVNGPVLAEELVLIGDDAVSHPYIRQDGSAMVKLLRVGGDSTWPFELEEPLLQLQREDGDGRTLRTSIDLDWAGQLTFIAEEQQIAYLDQNGVWHAPSDASLKQEVRPLGDMLDAVMRLRPVEFKWVDGDDAAERQLGFVAQDVEEVVPELVGRMPAADGSPPLRSMSYSPIDAVTVAAVRELKERTDERLEALQAEVEALRMLLARATGGPDEVAGDGEGAPS